MSEPSFVETTHNEAACIIQISQVRLVYVNNDNKTIVEFLDGVQIDIDETAEVFIAESFEKVNV